MNETEKLCKYIEAVEISMEEWQKQKEVQSNKASADPRLKLPSDELLKAV